MFNCLFKFCKTKEKVEELNIDNIYPKIIKKDKQEYINNAEIPKEWVEKISLSGETYWYNSKTKERTYVLPQKEIVQTFIKS
tara:strand:+ start:788 stop:1033 length:246 start_codon:yes stop_codon:yes gene_type:complete